MKTPSRSDLNQVSHTELVGLVLELLKRVEVLEVENAALRADNAALRARCEKLEAQGRESKRAGAPFSKGNFKAERKKAGRKAGEGIFRRRPEPLAGPTDVVEDVLVPLESQECPGCGAPLEVSEELATVADTPPQPTRWISRFQVEVGVCPQCGWRGRGTHAELASGQHGASAHRVGPQILVQGLSLHYSHGLPLCKVPAALKEMTGIDLSQSALTQAAGTLCRPSGTLAAVNEELRERIKSAAVVNTDDTGWRIGGRLAFLMGFFTPSEAVYQMRSKHRHEEVQEMIGAAFTGLLGTDRGSSYGAQALTNIEQQKCLSHLLKHLTEVENTAQGRAECLPARSKRRFERPSPSGRNITLAAAHQEPTEHGANPSKKSSLGYFEIGFSPMLTINGFLMASVSSTIAATSCASFTDRKSNRATITPSAVSGPPSSPEKSPIPPRTIAAPPSTRP